MTYLTKISSVIIMSFLITCTGSVVLAEDSSGKILIDENTLKIEGISINTIIGGDGEEFTLSQSILVGSIVNHANNGVSSIQIGTVDADDEITCQQLENSKSPSNTTNIVGNNKDISLNSRVSPSVCIKGSLNKIVILKNTEVGDLYLDGSDNEVYVSNAATVKRIEIVGQRNTLTLPKGHNISIEGLIDSNRVNIR